MKLKNWFSKLFHSNRKTKDKLTSGRTRSEKRPRGMKLEIEDLKKKLSDFLLTLKINSGIVIERKSYTLSKNAQGLYKLEGKEKSGRIYSIVVSTGNHLQMSSENKITGLIQVSEAELNRAIQFEYASLEGFLKKFSDLSLSEKSYEVISGEVFSWKEILLWKRFWQEMLFLKLSSNYIAVLIISLGDVFKNLFLEVATEKQKQIISDELFYLNQGVTSEEMNPNSKNISLLHFDKAYEEFKSTILTIKNKMESER